MVFLATRFLIFGLAALLGRLFLFRCASLGSPARALRVA